MIATLFKKSIRVRRLAKEGGWVVFGQMVAVSGTLALVRVLTEYLTPAEYGKLALGLTIAGLVNQVVMGGVVNGIGRFYSIATEKGDQKSYLRASIRLMGYTSLVVLGLAAILMPVLVVFDQIQWVGLGAVVLLFSVVTGFNASLRAIQNAARQRSIVALHSGMNSYLKIVLAVCIIFWWGANSIAVVIGYTISELIVTGSQLFFLRRFLRIHDQKKIISVKEKWENQIWSFSWPFSIWGIFTWAQQTSDRWALEIFASTQAVGQYVVVFQLGYTPISLFVGLAMSFLGPIFYQRSGSATDQCRNAKVHRLAWYITGMSLIVTGIAFFVTLFLHEWLFQLLVGSAFQSSSQYLPWVVLAGGLFAAGQILGLKLASEMKIKAQLAPKIGTAVMGIAMNLLGACFFGVYGVLFALVAFSIIYFFWMAWLAKNITVKSTIIYENQL